VPATGSGRGVREILRVEKPGIKSKQLKTSRKEKGKRLDRKKKKGHAYRVHEIGKKDLAFSYSKQN